MLGVTGGEKGSPVLCASSIWETFTVLVGGPHWSRPHSPAGEQRDGCRVLRRRHSWEGPGAGGDLTSVHEVLADARREVRAA